MDGKFKYLFTPIKIGPVSIKNRIFSAPHGTHFAESDGLPNERQAYYHADAANGGVGLIITGAIHIS